MRLRLNRIDKKVIAISIKNITYRNLKISGPLVFWRLLRRTLRRGSTREELWNGNRERLGPNLLSPQGILAWFFRTHWRHRREKAGKLAAYPHLQVLRFRTPGEAERWAATL